MVDVSVPGATSTPLRGTQPSAAAGFDLARGQDELTAFQDWMSARHPGSSLAWSLVLAETFDTDATEGRVISDADHQLAITNLCRLLREFLVKRVDAAG